MANAPFTLAADGRPSARRSSRCRISFLSGVGQAGKLRACDDLKYSLTNLARPARAPIQLFPWGRIAKIARFLSGKGDDWAIFKADLEPSYKQLPLDLAIS